MKTRVMGIMNITPDSFYDGGVLYSDQINTDAIIDLASRLIADGADILDIGGESTRPGAAPVSASEELSRVVPVIQLIKSRFSINISVDTYKASVAKEALKVGADIVNDISMLSDAEDMLEVLREYPASTYVLTHNRPGYVDMVSELKAKADELIRQGISASRIILDPGIGFNKSYEQNLIELGRLQELCRLDMPVLLGVSNKSVIGNTLKLPVEDRLEGTLALSVLAVKDGVRIIRVHDVKSNVRAIRMAEAVLSK